MSTAIIEFIISAAVVFIICSIIFGRFGARNGKT